MEIHFFDLIAKIGDFELTLKSAVRLHGKDRITALNILLGDCLKAGQLDSARKVAAHLIEISYS